MTHLLQHTQFYSMSVKYIFFVRSQTTFLRFVEKFIDLKFSEIDFQCFKIKANSYTIRKIDGWSYFSTLLWAGDQGLKWYLALHLCLKDNLLVWYRAHEQQIQCQVLRHNIYIHTSIIIIYLDVLYELSTENHHFTVKLIKLWTRMCRMFTNRFTGYKTLYSIKVKWKYQNDERKILNSTLFSNCLFF